MEFFLCNIASVCQNRQTEYSSRGQGTNSKINLRLGLSNIPFVVLGVHQFGQDLSGMAARIEVICVCQCLAFASLFATVPGEYMLVVIVVEVLVLVNVVVRHSSSENFRKVRLGKNNSVDTGEKRSCYSYVWLKLV